uniref:Carotenoid 1,2-hydratase n=1 Tax=Phenylobacterium glaciei TaxID=2803784 RepID=A0A974P0I4_9CAUL|nr:carotenoid 1,2-hydratase [Phenylobacterium glaciei]
MLCQPTPSAPFGRIGDGPRPQARQSGLAGLAAHRRRARQAGPARLPEVRAGTPLSFPADHGAHPDYRTEWWYVTGWLKAEDGRDLGFQLTFFRSRLAVDQRNPSAFAPKQILFAHAGLSDPKVGRLLHDGRIARQGLGLAEAATGDADLVIDDWRLKRGADGRFLAKAAGADFTLDLAFAPSQPVLLQGIGASAARAPCPSRPATITASRT